jgi:hypothetical protein
MNSPLSIILCRMTQHNFIINGFTLSFLQGYYSEHFWMERLLNVHLSLLCFSSTPPCTFMRMWTYSRGLVVPFPFPPPVILPTHNSYDVTAIDGLLCLPFNMSTEDNNWWFGLNLLYRESFLIVQFCFKFIMIIFPISPKAIRRHSHRNVVKFAGPLVGHWFWKGNKKIVHLLFPGVTITVVIL